LQSNRFELDLAEETLHVVAPAKPRSRYEQGGRSSSHAIPESLSKDAQNNWWLGAYDTPI
jgi:hypothetical protein